MIGRNKQATFGYLLLLDETNKLLLATQGSSMTNNQLLEQQVFDEGWREVMIKYVLQVIPSYVMSVFLLPKTLIYTIEKNDEWLLEKLSIHKN